MNDFDEIMNIQRSMSSRLMNEAAVDRKLEFIELVSSLKTDKKGRIQIETIIIEAKLAGITESESNSLILELERDSYLKKLEPGFVKMNF